jgi:hypothetical protein
VVGERTLRLQSPGGLESRESAFTAADAIDTNDLQALGRSPPTPTPRQVSSLARDSAARPCRRLRFAPTMRRSDGACVT